MQFAVIGLGAFGRTCAIELQNQGNEVIGIDLDEQEIDKVSNILSHSVIADATNQEVINELNLTQLDGVLVSIGDDLEASLLCALNLINLKVKNLWVKAKTDAHHTILESIGVKNIIHPEQDMGIRIAQAMNYPLVKQYLSLGNDEFIIRIDVPRNWQSQKVGDVRRKHVNTPLLIVVRNGEIIRDFDEDTLLQPADKLVFSGLIKPLKALAKHFQVGY